MHQVVSTRHPSISLRGIALGLLTLCALPATAHAAGRVVLELRPATRTSADGWITVVARNVGDESVPIMRLDTPFARKTGTLPGAALDVVDADGNEVRYRGGWDYFGRLTMDHFTELRPGEQWENDIDVGHEYEVRPGGTYRVRYRLRLDHEPDVDVVPAALRETFRRPAQALAESNELTLHIVGDPTAMPTISSTSSWIPAHTIRDIRHAWDRRRPSWPAAYRGSTVGGKHPFARERAPTAPCHADAGTRSLASAPVRRLAVSHG
ncbi:hypothetical protein [Luteibacter sp. 329MFSha]|uniref:hypothetical protein n=1 Tax=Luteibacter sp. 329MFSha TaxID=1798239 RepID=UPI0008CA3C8B|nr:hypothetical protein [Luteibacter sp. 329MFSha]SEW05622.1 hypothetical protein SAMN04515660_2159 [Luteibacter sp. 329MFSha]